jgi:hypothetical protein
MVSNGRPVFQSAEGIVKDPRLKPRGGGLGRTDQRAVGIGVSILALRRPFPGQPADVNSQQYNLAAAAMSNGERPDGQSRCRFADSRGQDPPCSRCLAGAGLRDGCRARVSRGASRLRRGFCSASGCIRRVDGATWLLGEACGEACRECQTARSAESAAIPQPRAPPWEWNRQRY